MSDALHNAHWYRVAKLKPQLCSHVQINRHHYRNQRWYILTDKASGHSYRFNPSSYLFISLMNGLRNVDEIQQAVEAQLGNRAPSEAQVIQLLGQLHTANILQCDAPPDTLELFERQRRHKRGRLKQRLLAPLAVRFPLLDPERFLTRWQQLLRPLFTRTAFIAWLALMLVAVALAGQHWSAITDNLIDRVMTPQNLVLLWLSYPLVKALHELGHAFATRVWGGEVHEMGIMLLVLMPIPYVDASAATAFESKQRRMVVGAAGIIVELTLAALALLVWINVEHGMVSAIAYNIMLIGSVSTLFFNGNPLLRFDAYYVLADAIEIPNLGSRSNQQLGYLVQRYLFGIKQAESPVMAHGEAGWFVFYGLMAFIYRMSILFVILVYVASKFFIIGVLLAVWAIAAQLVLPLFRQAAFLLNSPRLREQRTRALTTTITILALLAGSVLFVPAPLTTRAEGIVWLPEQSRIRVGTDCFVSDLLAEPGATVHANQPVIECQDPLLDAHADFLEARLRELRARLTAELQIDRVKAAGIREEIRTVESEYRLVKLQLAALTLRSPGNGNLVIPDAADLDGKYLHKGDIIAWVTNGASSSARVVVTQTESNLVRQRTRDVRVRIAGHLDQVIQATVTREVPAATDKLPSAALGSRYGGRIAVDPQEESGNQALQKVFQFDLALNGPPPSACYGQRVQVLFDHGSESLAGQWQRSLRQLFLGQFGV